MRYPIILGVCFLLSGNLILAQDEEEMLASGPQAGKALPAPFDCLIINGKFKGRQHCLVCDQALNRAVLVFTREPGKGNEGQLPTLMAKLDEALERHQDANLRGAVVILSPAAKNSANNPEEEDPLKLVAEAKERLDLVNRLSAHADKLKHLVVGCYPPPGPKGYNLNPKAETTVLVYEKHKVLANFAFAEGKITEADVAKIMTSIESIKKK